MQRTSLKGAPPIDVARHLGAEHRGGLIFFDSGKSSTGKARWSILACHPSAILTEHEGQLIELPGGDAVCDPVAWMEQKAAPLPMGRPLRGPDPSTTAPFFGGVAGFLGFEFAWWLEAIGAKPREAQTPVLWVGAFDAAACFDHESETWHVGGVLDGVGARALMEAIEVAGSGATPGGKGGGARLGIEPEVYRERVAECIDAIYCGEIFEVNYTERFRGRWDGGAFGLFEALRGRADGAFGGFLDAGEFAIASVSPEQFVAVDGPCVMTRPIKGTRPRGASVEEDARLGAELLVSEKDRAENVMIVDLMRNDLTRVCALGSVRASAVCALESFEGVHHLVSTVEGRLEPGFEALDVLLACFPAGSITGAPKLRAIELIAKIEQDARGPYTGSMFYLSREGRLDSNVLIRTATLVGTDACYGAGGAVVADSDPGEEHLEAELKARAFVAAMGEQTP
ncbi:MAG: anthranilate synthase component I family protein [Bradymonadaceae bacterium]|nr:anthranilate synthase component I family protein [Lujinxingiaceae bacterium]